MQGARTSIRDMAQVAKALENNRGGSSHHDDEDEGDCCRICRYRARLVWLMPVLGTRHMLSSEPACLALDGIAVELTTTAFIRMILCMSSALSVVVQLLPDHTVQVWCN